MRAKKQADKIKQKTAIASLTFSHRSERSVAHDVEVVKRAIFEQYGIKVTDEYCVDLIAFVDAMTQEMVS